MRTETVEIFSDASNAAVIRHPGRKFPGVLIQGDTLSIKYQMAEEACEAARGKLSDEHYQGLMDLRDWLLDLLRHYKSVLAAHEIGLPFDAQVMPDRRPSPTVMTDRQAYTAMFHFLEQFYLRGKSAGLVDLLSGMPFLNDGSTADPAQWHDWCAAVEYAMKGGDPPFFRLGPPG